MITPQPTTVDLDRIRIPDDARPADPGLVASVSRHGVLEPVGLVEDGDGYRVLYGARRIAACRTLGLETIPAVVYPVGLSPDQEKTFTLVENLQRANLTPLEAGDGFLALLGLGLSQAEIARQVSRPLSYVTSRVAVAQLPPQARDLLAGIPYNPTAVSLLARLPPPRLMEVLERNPAAASSNDAARDALRTGLRVDAAPFDAADCHGCAHIAADCCLDRDCWGEKVAEAVGYRIADLRSQPDFRDAPCVCERAVFDFASETDREIFKRFAAAPLRHQRLAADGEDGEPAILLGHAGEVRPVRIVPQRATAPGDGRTDRFTRADHGAAVAEREVAVQLAGKLRERLASGELEVREDLGELCRALAELVVLHPVDDAGALATLARLALPRISAWAQVSAVSRPLGGWKAFAATLRRLLGED